MPGLIPIASFSIKYCHYTYEKCNWDVISVHSRKNLAAFTIIIIIDILWCVGITEITHFNHFMSLGSNVY